MKRRCSQSKEEIVNILAEEFYRVRDDLDNTLTENKVLYQRNYGRYQAMMDLMSRIHIYEE